MYTTIIVNPGDIRDLVILIVPLIVWGFITRKIHQTRQGWFGRLLLLFIFWLLTLCNLGFVLLIIVSMPRNLGDFTERTIGIRTPLKRIYYDMDQMYPISFDFYLEEIYEIPKDVAQHLKSPPPEFWDYPQGNYAYDNVQKWKRGPLTEKDQDVFYLPASPRADEDDPLSWQLLDKAGQALHEGRGYYSYMYDDGHLADFHILILLPDEQLLIIVVNER